MTAAANVFFAVLFGASVAVLYWLIATAFSVARWYLRLLLAALLEAVQALIHHGHGAQ